MGRRVTLLTVAFERERRRHMAYGPIELLVVGFPGSEPTGRVAPALAELVDSGLIRIIDILFIQKDADGVVTETELSELSEDLYVVFDPLVSDLDGLLTDDDAVRIGAALPPNSSAGIMLFENVWAKSFADAVSAANGQVILNERIPRAVIEELVASQVDELP
jgi:uncharacterized membrane protein